MSGVLGNMNSAAVELYQNSSNAEAQLTHMDNYQSQRQQTQTYYGVEPTYYDTVPISTEMTNGYGALL